MDTSNDNDNCGTCSNVCPDGATCIGGECRDEPCYPYTEVTDGQTGNFGTTGPACYRVAEPVQDWNCSNFQGRTLMVNDVDVSCGEMPLPAPYNGYYYFEVSAGDVTYASMSIW